jgi:hypothetical protein
VKLSLHRRSSRLPEPALPQAAPDLAESGPAPFSAWAQRELGNRAVQAALMGRTGEEGALDRFLAAQVGDEASGRAVPSGSPSNSAMLALLRAYTPAEEAPASIQPLVAKSAGRPLPGPLAARMGSALGHDLSHVTVHTDTAAQQAAEALGAHAFALGADLYFGAGEYAPGNTTGDELLLHELQHVVQHDEGRLPSSPGFSVSSPSDAPEREAEQVARAAVGQLDAPLEPAPSPAPAAGPGPVMRSALGDAVGAVTGAVEGGVVEAVRLVSPALAELLEGGLGAVAEELLGESLEAFVGEVAGELDLTALMAGLFDEIRGIFAVVQGVLSGDPRCCETFDGWMQTLSDVLTQLNDNPLAVAIREGLSAVGGVVGELMALFVGAELQRFLTAVGGAKAVFDGYLALIGAGQQAVADLADWVWDGVCELLGIEAGEGNIVDAVMAQAQTWFADSLAEAGPGLFEAWQTMASLAWELSPMRPLYELVGALGAVGEAGAFLWAHWGSPTLVEDAAQTSALAQGFIAAFLSASEQTSELASWATEFFGEALAQSEANADSLGMGWIVRGSQALLSVLMLPLQLGVDFGGWLMADGTATIAGWATAVWDYFLPFMEVMTSLVLAVANPPMIPIILAGWAWRMLPDCLKPPLVDLLLDVVIDALVAMPELPGLQGLWGVLEPGLVGALGAFRGRSDEEKILITDRFAKILTGSPEFVLGFVVGVLKGMLDGVLDPIMLVWMAVEGLLWLLDTAGGLMESAVGEAEVAAPAAEAAITLMPQGAGELEQGAAEPDLQAWMARAGAEVRPPAETIGATFVPAFEEAFSGEGATSVADLASMVGSLWETMQSLAADAGAYIGQKLCETMLTTDVGYTLGYGVGYVTGVVVWEVVLGFLTGGLWSTLGPTARAVVKFLDLGGELFGAAFRLLGELGSLLLKAVGPLLDWLGSTGLMRTLREAFLELAGKLVSLSDELTAMLGSSGRKADEAGGVGDELGTARRSVVAGDDVKLSLAAQRIRPEPGVFDVVVHGDGQKLLVLDGGAWTELSPTELAARMKAEGHAGESVRLVACGTGQADGAAARLARELGVDVKAPTDTVWIHPDGTLTVGPTPDASSGGWSVTTPGGAQEVVEDSARLGDDALERVDEAVGVGRRGRGPMTPEEEAARRARNDLNDPGGLSHVRRGVRTDGDLERLPRETDEAFLARLERREADLRKALETEQLRLLEEGAQDLDSPRTAQIEAGLDDIMRRRENIRCSLERMGARNPENLWDTAPTLRGTFNDLPGNLKTPINATNMSTEQLHSLALKLQAVDARRGLTSQERRILGEALAELDSRKLIREAPRFSVEIPATQIVAEIITRRADRVMVGSQEQADEVFRLLDRMAEQRDLITRQPANAISEGGRIDLPFRGPERHVLESGPPTHAHFNADIVLSDSTPLNVHIFFPDKEMPTP